jgi:hypothetical protein
MVEKLEPEVAKIGIRLLEDAYMAWVSAEAEASLALRAWFDGAPRHDGGAYYAYLAALDREGAAALDLQRLSALADPCRVAVTEHQEQLGQVQRGEPR